MTRRRWVLHDLNSRFICLNRTVLLRLVYIRAFLQQQSRHIDVAFLAGDVQRRHTVFIRLIDLRAVVQQQPRSVNVAVLAGDV